MINKKHFLLFLILIALVINGCNDTKVSGGKHITVISYGHGFTVDSPHHKAALKFKEEIDQATNGSILINIYPSGNLGTAQEMYEGLKSGMQDIALIPTARISKFTPELQLFDLPFLFPDRQVAYEVMDGDIGGELLKYLERDNIRGVAFYEDGFKNFTSNSPISKLEDFQGLKFRTMESEIVIDQFEGLGAEPVPMDFADLTSALQRGSIDGQENPLVTIVSLKLYEIQPYLTISEHGYLGHVLMFSESLLESLPKNTRDLLIEKGKEIAIWQREAVQNQEKKYLEIIENYGVKVINLSEEERERMKEATMSAHRLYEEKYGSAILNSVYDTINKHK